MLDKAYQQVLAKGPDFINSRTGGEFRQATKLGIDRNAFARTAATSRCKIMLDICKVLFYTDCILVEGK